MDRKMDHKNDPVDPIKQLVHPDPSTLEAYRKEHLDWHPVPGRGTAASGVIPEEALEASEQARSKAPGSFATPPGDPFQESRVSTREPVYHDEKKPPA